MWINEDGSVSISPQYDHCFDERLGEALKITIPYGLCLNFPYIYMFYHWY